ncbi:GNAT family N-acetyltransferase [Candidatus Pelagibacter sp.]|nr:GNAT family N-acetyltransferase [Candidatus Pelagibacter sp.]
MKTKIERNYLEIKSLKELNESNSSFSKYFVKLVEPVDFQLNKFFYKNVGKDHHWVDRLVWTEKDWIEYVKDPNVKTYVLKKKEDLIGYFELILHKDENEVEIAYLGLLEEHLNKKLGSYILTLAIKKSFTDNPNRVWVHTCSLDHKNALSNYLSRGMKIFKKEILNF